MDALPPRSPWRVAKPTRWPERPQVEGLIEEGTDAVPVRITIVQDGFVTGWDDGAMGFDNDAVWFSGRACSFRIVALDLEPLAYASESDMEESLPLRHPTRKVSVQIEALPAPDRDPLVDRASLDAGIERLRLLRRANGVSQYPPLAPRPGLSDDRLAWRTPVSVVVSAAAVLVAFGIWGPTHSSPILVPILCLVAILRGKPEPDRRALRRIAEEEEYGTPPAKASP